MPTLKIDVHTHILPKHWPDLEKKYGYPGWLKLDHQQSLTNMLLDGKHFRTIECNCFSPEQRLREMISPDCVSVQVLSTVPVMFSYWAKADDTLDLSRYLNDHIAQVVAEHPTSFIGLGTLPMQNPAMAVQELRRCMNELGLKGVQIGSHINEWNLDVPELQEFWSAVEELDAAVFVHPWDMERDLRMSKYWFPWLIGMPSETTVAISSMLFGGVFERHPKLKVCFAHGGGSFPGTIGRLEHGFQVRPDLCQQATKIPPSHYLGQIYVDSLVHDEATLQFLVQKMTKERVMLGSDYPFPLGEQCPGQLVANSKLDDETKELILWKNACRFFNINPDDFLPKK